MRIKSPQLVPIFLFDGRKFFFRSISWVFDIRFCCGLRPFFIFFIFIFPFSRFCFTPSKMENYATLSEFAETVEKVFHVIKSLFFR